MSYEANLEFQRRIDEAFMDEDSTRLGMDIHALGIYAGSVEQHAGALRGNEALQGSVIEAVKHLTSAIKQHADSLRGNEALQSSINDAVADLLTALVVAIQ